VIYLLVILASGLEPVAVTDHVDILETNYYHDENAKLVFAQRIYWRWNGEAFECVDWRLVKDCNYPHGKQITWNDSGTLRREVAKSVRVTHTQYDPELEQRKELDKDHRKELTRPPSRTRVKELLKGK
jgi:hypothetical protein